jgi:hypothetical protein
MPSIVSKTSLHPEDALTALEIYREERKTNKLDAVFLNQELAIIVREARNARLKWREIALAAGVSRSYVMRVWKESNGEKT